jgi:hypothetical protein
MSDLEIITDKEKFKARLKKQLTLAVGDKLKLMRYQSTLSRIA